MSEPEVEPLIPPTYTPSHAIYRYDGNVRQQQVGVADNETDACVLAGSWFQTAQHLYPTVAMGVGVVEISSDNLICWIGWRAP